MARKGSAKYQPLSYPNPGTIRIPDVALLRSKRQLRLIQEIAAAAWDNLSAIMRRTGCIELSQALGKLEFTLVDLMNPNKEADQPDTRAIVAGTRLGYVIGTMENGSGVAHSNQSESHYTAAMLLISARLADELPPTAMSEFATECGYVLARSGDEALDILTEIAEKHAEKLRTASRPQHAAPGSDFGTGSTSTPQHAAKPPGSELSSSSTEHPEDYDIDYDLTEWTSDHRTRLTRLLDATGIPFSLRNLYLVVDPEHESEVDDILDSMNLDLE